jgi:hypothetical protein
MAPEIKVAIGRDTFWIDNPEIKIQSVCRGCNNGWMGRLETANREPIHAMINSDRCALTKKDQRKLVLWSLMKAMVIDSVNPHRRLFYLDKERSEVKSGTIPSACKVSLGRLSAKAFHSSGTNVWGDVDKIPMCFEFNVTNIIMGHVTIEVLTAHSWVPLSGTVGLKPKDGPWDETLVELPADQTLQWPPPISFTLGASTGVRGLLNRWKIGKEIH